MLNRTRHRFASPLSVVLAVSRILAFVVCLSLLNLAVQGQEKALVVKPAIKAAGVEPFPDALVPTYRAKEPINVTLTCDTPGAMIRYSLDGTTPANAEDGMIYENPIPLEKTGTIVAVAFKAGSAPSRRASANFLFGPQKGQNTLHFGNSLTDTTQGFADQVRTTGHLHTYHSLTAGGALTRQLWEVERNKQGDRWKTLQKDFTQVNHVTVQPRDFSVPREAGYDIRFFDLIREKSPEVQPWLYCEWVEKNRSRPTDQAKVASSQMKKLYPALTWEESMGAMLLYVEELQSVILKTYQGKKRPRIIPSAIAMGIVSDLIERGKFPGHKGGGGSFYPFLFQDDVHPNENGAFLVNCTWYAAFYGESPEDRLLPLGTTLTADQARVIQQVAWRVVKNYPESGLFEEGDTPVDAPRVAPKPMPISKGTRLELSCSTPDVLYRYTLDGTVPTRNRGYVYCGIISIQPGMTIKVVAFKSGMADSPVTEVTFPAK